MDGSKKDFKVRSAFSPAITTANYKRNFYLKGNINKEYVDTAIGSGQADFMNKALQTTEIARAMAHDSHVSTMTIMKFSVGVLAVLFFLNSFYLFRLQREAAPAPLVTGS